MITNMQQHRMDEFLASAVIAIVLSAGWLSNTFFQSICCTAPQDLVSIAMTGSGKTMGYMLPAIIHCMHQQRQERGDGPIVLVLSPTRELAQQIQQQAEKFGGPCNMRNACLFGGAPKGAQVSYISIGGLLRFNFCRHNLYFFRSEISSAVARSAWPRQAGSSTFSRWGRLISAAALTSCWTRQTACSTW